MVIPTRNEAERLDACLASVSWAAEVIVADAGSTDATLQVASRRRARVLANCSPPIGAQRNAAIRVAAYPWILAIDADERATPELRDAIAEAIAQPTTDAYQIRMRNRYLGESMERGSWGRDWHTRLFRAHLRFDLKRVHEGLDYRGSVGRLAGEVDHDSYRDLSHHISKVGTYSRWGAEDLQQRGRHAGISDLTMRPLWRFVRAYLIDGNWHDGRRGLIFSVIHAWAAFSKYALLWDADRQLTAVQPRRVAAGERAVVAPIPPAAATVPTPH